jgi:hypothetical protein
MVMPTLSLDQQAIDILKKYFKFDKIFNLYDYDQNMESLYDELSELKKPVFEPNYRFIFLHFDTEYYISNVEPGTTLLNLQRILTALDIDNYFCLIITQQNLENFSKMAKERDMTETTSIATISAMLWDLYHVNVDTDLKMNTDKISKKYMSLNNVNRFHRRCLLALLKKNKMLDHSIVSYNHVN